MKKFKLFGASTLALVGALSLVACNGQGTPTATTSGEPAPTTTQTTTGTGTSTTIAPAGDKEIVLYNALGQDLENVMKPKFETFKQKYGWTVRSVRLGGYDDLYKQCITDLQAGTAPDLGLGYADHVAAYLKSGKVVDMKPFFESTATVKDAAGNDVTLGYTAAERADFVQSYLNEGKGSLFGGATQYGFTADSLLLMPYAKSTEALYYNADALQYLGVEVPQTWEEVWDICADVREHYENATPFCYDSESNWFITMCEQNGWGYTSVNEPHYLFKNDNTIAFLTDLASKYEEGYIQTQKTYGGYTSALFTKGVENGETGCVFCVGSTGGAGHQDPAGAFTWGVAPVPGKLVNGQVVRKQISQGPSFYMFNNGEERTKMAWLFVKEVLAPEFQGTYSMAAGYNPVRLSTYDIDEYKDWLDDETNIKAAVVKMAKGLAEANAFYSSPVFSGSAQARLEVNAAMVYAIKGQKTAAKALTDAENNIV